jgi:hypothetical protein
MAWLARGVSSPKRVWLELRLSVCRWSVVIKSAVGSKVSGSEFQVSSLEENEDILVRSSFSRGSGQANLFEFFGGGFG